MGGRAVGSLANGEESSIMKNRMFTTKFIDSVL